MAGGAAHHGLGVVGDAEAGGAEHGQVVGAVANGDGLRQPNALLFRDVAQQRGLSLGVDDLAAHLAGDQAILNLEFVGEHVIDAEAGLEPFADVLEPPG